VSDVHLFLFFLLVTGFSWDAGGVPVSWKIEEFAFREVKSICGAHCCWCGAKIEIGMGPKMVHVTTDTCVRCEEHGESRMVRPLCTNRKLPLE
jgi:hypothetical protein